MEEMNKITLYAEYLKEVVTANIKDESDRNIFLNRIDNSRDDMELQDLVASDIDDYMRNNNLGNE